MNRAPLLFLNVLIVAVCGLIYELLAGTLASYVLGDSVTQFSLIIGIYLSAMGVGAYLSRFLDKALARRFLDVEVGVALVGGVSAPLLFITFARAPYFQPILYGYVFVIGVLVGLELPLLMRILKEKLDFKELVSKVLAFDYLGALVASILFPLLFVPRLGLVRTSMVMGILNACVALWGTWILRPHIEGSVTGLRVRSLLVIALLLVGVAQADRMTRYSEEQLFADEIIYTKQSHYQRIVVTSGGHGFQLFLNGNLQFSSVDEYRYHEALVHPAMVAAGGPRNVLILGGGDGLAAREVLRWPGVERVTLVDLDPEMTTLARKFPPLAELSRHSLEDPRLTVINRDAMLWLEEPGPPVDVAIVDFPDPNSFAVGKLYTTRFYKLLAARLAPGAAVAVQATSPLFARTSYWCIVRTMEAAGFTVRPYQTAVPSFGIWGFALAKRAPFELLGAPPAGLRFLNQESMGALFVFPGDLGPPEDVEINRLDNQALVRIYEGEWRRWE
jgi:spermidine synthase